MSIKIKEDKFTKIEIDLNGPNGNVFVLISTAKNIMNRLKYPEVEKSNVISEMKSSDYSNAVRTFHSYFKDYVELEMTESLFNDIFADSNEDLI